MGFPGGEDTETRDDGGKGLLTVGFGFATVDGEGGIVGVICEWSDIDHIGVGIFPRGTAAGRFDGIWRHWKGSCE